MDIVNDVVNQKLGEREIILAYIDSDDSVDSIMRMEIHHVIVVENKEVEHRFIKDLQIS